MQFFFFVDISEDMSKSYVQYFHNPIESLFYLVICHITEDEYVEMSFQVVFQKILTYNITLLVSYNISSILFFIIITDTVISVRTKSPESSFFELQFCSVD